MGYHEGGRGFAIFCDLYSGCGTLIIQAVVGYKVSLLTSPRSWVSGLYLLSERMLTSSYAHIIGDSMSLDY